MYFCLCNLFYSGSIYRSLWGRIMQNLFCKKGSALQKTLKRVKLKYDGKRCRAQALRHLRVPCRTSKVRKMSSFILRTLLLFGLLPLISLTFQSFSGVWGYFFQKVPLRFLSNSNLSFSFTRKAVALLLRQLLLIRYYSASLRLDGGSSFVSLSLSLRVGAHPFSIHFFVICTSRTSSLEGISYMI